MIRCACQHCGETVEVDETKAGRSHVCPLCGQQSLVPDTFLHLRRHERLQELGRTRHLTSEELSETAQRLQVLGRKDESERAIAAAKRQEARERQAAALDASGVNAPPEPRDSGRRRMCYGVMGLAGILLLGLSFATVVVIDTVA